MIEIIHQTVINGSVDLVVDYLLSDCIEKPEWKLQTCFVLNEVIRACQEIKGSGDFHEIQCNILLVLTEMILHLYVFLSLIHI